MRNVENDNGGVSGIIPEIRIMTGLDYERILSRVDSNTYVKIYTYDLYEEIEFYEACLRHLHKCDVIVNGSRITQKKIDEFNAKLPNVNVIQKPDTHAKMILIEPEEVYLSSQNFSRTDWFQHAVYIKDREAYSVYATNALSYENCNYTGNIKMNLSHENIKHTIQANDISGMYQPDYEGIILNEVEGKFAESVNWNQKLNNVRKRDMYICTHTLPDMKYIRQILNKLCKEGNRIRIIANSSSGDKLCELTKDYSDLTFYLFNNFHAKMVLFSPQNVGGKGTVWLSSQNFGASGYFENLVMFKSSQAYQYYVEKLEEFVGHEL